MDDFKELDDLDEAEILDSTPTSPMDFSPEDLNLPSKTEIVTFEAKFGALTLSPEGIRQKVIEKLVPKALLVYDDLLRNGDQKMKKEVADEIMEIAGTAGKAASGGALSGNVINNFPVLSAENKEALGTLAKVFRGEIQTIDGESEVLND